MQNLVKLFPDGLKEMITLFALNKSMLVKYV